ncbi:tetratricopeptide repeat protein [Candidatus Nitrosopumilus salaria BD31]|uniref:Tetratricopeptide repeat protein n=1 Tax=Candidatus Nitrosopumilus salarius BD31 TaxID=859350 RepID=I3D1Y9_9ARCH|nr:tetratricopeptide repeat protein [Candidatus Nitrosopumilus salaria]EIJ65732.1 tetratricopeptide repeat protein [Candidatus Nitrosopumilus salaria BD31]
MKKLFREKSKKNEEKKLEKSVKEETSIVDSDYNRKKLFKRGINLMADEKLEEAIEIFEQALRIDPSNIETLMKLGYARFHIDDYSEALKIYDRILDIDVTNPEAWNLKGLVHYEQKNYSKALDAVQKAIESDPTYGMAWYNQACFLSLLNQVPESLEALKRSIEIDVKNARKSIRDKDFMNVRIEEGFKRIQEVVVLESIRQGYHTLGAIVWTTFLDKADADNALEKLLEKGLIVQNEKRDGLSKIPIYDLAPNVAEKIGKEKKGLFGITKKTLPKPVKNLKELSQAIQSVKEAIEEGDVEKTIEIFDVFIDPTKSGEQMIENFFDEHREIRLWKIRLKDRGEDYLIDNKDKMLVLFDNIEGTVTKKLRNEISS